MDEKKDYTYLNAAEIKVGDRVGILRLVSVGFGYQAYRHKYAKPEVITRITPKRTKFFGENGQEYAGNSNFVALDDFALSENECAECLRNSVKNMDRLRTLSASLLLKLSDEDIKRFSGMFSEIVEKLEEAEKNK